ncbi:hypothetical protein vseg_015798 [Gypsophila vaccaria]
MAAVGKQPPQQPPPPSSSSSMVSKDDLWKRCTDCVYFLASPLTCKKGSECEYRHSETARKNPKECWYWLNATCTMHANCVYRHPPLDVLVPPPNAGNYAGPSPSVPPSGQPFTSTPQNAAKQAVPCVFFQGGGCAKGYRCPYLHGPIPQANTKIQPVQATTAAKEAPMFKKSFAGPEKDSQPKMNTFIRNAAPEVEKPRLVEGASTVKHYPPRGVIDETSNFRQTIAPPAGNGNFRSRAAPHRASSVDDQNHHNGRDVDDSLRESSPGFDVLVDTKLEEDEYYHDEDQYVRMRGHEGRRSGELDRERYVDYDSMADIDHDVYHGKRGYDEYDGLRDKYAREQRGVSSERPPVHDRRGPYKPESADFMQNSSDLRHRLSKQQRGTGLRSVVSPDYKPDHQSKDLEYRNSRRDTRRSPTRVNSIGSRLRGRINLPRRSPPLSDRNTYRERDNRERNLGRFSPSRPRLSSIRGRLRDRLGGRVQEDSYESRSVRSQGRDDFSTRDNGDAFVAPKRLSELRGNKHIDNMNQQLTGRQSVPGGKLRDTVLGGSPRIEGDISFDGPKPLSEILKRKRKAAVNCDDTKVENGAHLTSNTANNSEDTEKPIAVSSAPEQTPSGVQENNEPPIIEADDVEEAKISNKKVKLSEDESSLPDEQHPETEEDGLSGGNGEEAEVEEGFDQGDVEEVEVDEEFDQGDREYVYEHDDDVDGYDLNEGDVAENEGFMDEDEGDDFAKKLGVSF